MQKLPGVLQHMNRRSMYHPAETTREAEGLPTAEDAIVANREPHDTDQELLAHMQKLPRQMTNEVLRLAERGGYQQSGFVNYAELEDMLGKAVNGAYSDMDNETVEQYARHFGIELFPEDRMNERLYGPQRQ